MIIIITSISKNNRDFFRYNILQITYAMSSTSLFLSIMATAPKVTIFFIFSMFIFNFFFFKCNSILDFYMIFVYRVFITFFFSLKLKIHKTFSYSFYLILIFHALKWWYCRHHLLLLRMNLKNHIYIRQSFLLNIQDLHN